MLGLYVDKSQKFTFTQSHITLDSCTIVRLPCFKVRKLISAHAVVVDRWPKAAYNMDYGTTMNTEKCPTNTWSVARYIGIKKLKYYKHLSW